MRSLHVETHQSKNFVYVILRDRNAGKRNRFTTHRIALCGFQETYVIGRELTLAHSRRIVNDEIGVQ